MWSFVVFRFVTILLFFLFFFVYTIIQRPRAHHFWLSFSINSMFTKLRLRLLCHTQPIREKNPFCDIIYGFYHWPFLLVLSKRNNFIYLWLMAHLSAAHLILPMFVVSCSFQGRSLRSYWSVVDNGLVIGMINCEWLMQKKMKRKEEINWTVISATEFQSNWRAFVMIHLSVIVTVC